MLGPMETREKSKELISEGFIILLRGKCHEEGFRIFGKARCASVQIKYSYTKCGTNVHTTYSIRIRETIRLRDHVSLILNKNLTNAIKSLRILLTR